MSSGLNALLPERGLVLGLESLVDLGAPRRLVAMVLCRTRGGLVVLGSLGLGLAVLLLRGLVELVGNRLLVLAVEVLVRVLSALLVRRVGVLVGLARCLALVSAAPVYPAGSEVTASCQWRLSERQRRRAATNRCIRVCDLVDIVIVWF